MRGTRDSKRLLSARNLEDVPVNVRIGSPFDAPDKVVFQFASKGLLPPATNYGVVYRVAFAPVLESDEEAAPPTTLQGLPIEDFPTNLLLRLGFAFPPDLISGEVKMSRNDLEQGRYQAWILLTTRGVRWHFTGDGAPQIHPGLEPDLGGGLRFLPYGDLRGRSEHLSITLPTSSQSLAGDLFVFDVGRDHYGFAMSGAYAPENLRWYDFIRGRRV